jgi:hypothetical protein
MSAPIAFQGEVMLAGWSETHNGGAKVTFWLADEGDLAAFKSMTVAKGKTAGQRLAIVAVEIGDDEQPVSPQADQAKGGELAKLAGIFCCQSEFYDFAGLTDRTMEGARDWILRVCGIQSRRDLDHNPTAAKIFHDRVRKPYLESRK